jgi:3-oxoacyl-[acyl-carrier protein] reductase
MSAKVAIVFGGSRGAAIALRLAKDGFDVALACVSRPDQTGDIASAIENFGRHAVAIKADSADPSAIRTAVAEAVQHLGTLDAAAVNAGVLRLASVEAFTLEDLDLSLDVNVRGAFLAITDAVGATMSAAFERIIRKGQAEGDFAGDLDPRIAAGSCRRPSWG